MSVIRRTLFQTKYSNLKNKVVFLRSIVTGEHQNILKSQSSDIIVKDVTIPQMLYESMEPNLKYIGAISGTTGRSYTFEQIRIKSRNFSKVLREKFKLKDGDVIAMFLPNVPEYVICFLGSLEARLIVTTMNPMYTADEIAKQIIDASPKLIVTQANLVSTARSALELTKRQLPLIIVKETQAESLPEGTIDLSELINTHLDVPDLLPGKADDVAIMPYSSGTTGLPKGVLLTHKNMTSNLTQMSHPDFSSVEPPTDNFQDMSPAVLPFYHIYGLTLNFLFICQGTRCVALDKFTPESYIAALKNNPISMIFAAPPLVLFLTAHPDVKSEYFKNLKTLSCGAAPLGSLDEERFLQKVGRDVNIVQGYGLTEASPVVSFTPKNLVRSEKNVGSVGRLVSNTTAKIINPDDPEGTPLGPNEKGEILLKGPQVMKGYYNRPKETENTFLDGWLRTGDIGYYNEDNMLYISDRLKELIKVRGFQVAPAELEEIIRDHPSVAEAAVIGIPHPLSGEVPRAYIVPKKDKTVDLEELDQYVSNKVAKYKKLSGGIQVVDVIPKNPSGKILRRKLKENYLEKEI
ncbi:probable 4-coumarate--CoA ligase 3 isoform X1 [Diabrotica virgifera virgifera]|uniref:Probable 4-coumarate--CoA ligase 3 isoform X2 n=1 Tax=Diabrotica virgifera virgifera TaxID=50390 RepID=A0A6P7G138_DIAVI|nr:probable 4-coumarate--CoA ligase 3 isoform X1 [Diabrotica virgifera virgifera]